jgi:transposase
MVRLENQSLVWDGPHGQLTLPDEEVARKFAMLIEGQCHCGPAAAAEKFGFSRQRYFQLLSAVQTDGLEALRSKKRGPKAPSRRTPETIAQIVRHRFLDPEASAAVIAQKMNQSGCPISTRSVERTITEFGLQKKTVR